MNEDKRAIYDLIENYFYNCELYGHSDFDGWCEDNLHNEEQKELYYKVREHANAIADILFN